jgi:hypothetical protein
MEIKAGLSALVTGGASGIGNFNHPFHFSITITYQICFYNFWYSILGKKKQT